MATKRASGKAERSEPKELPLFAIDRGIEKLRKRLVELRSLASGDRKDPQVKVFEAELPKTVEDIFGFDSREAVDYQNFQVAKIGSWSRGEPEHQAEMRRKSWFTEGANQKIALIQGLISRLEEMREDWRRCPSCNRVFRLQDYCLEDGSLLVSLAYSQDAPTLQMPD